MKTLELYAQAGIDNYLDSIRDAIKNKIEIEVPSTMSKSHTESFEEASPAPNGWYSHGRNLEQQPSPHPPFWYSETAVLISVSCETTPSGPIALLRDLQGAPEQPVKTYTSTVTVEISPVVAMPSWGTYIPCSFKVRT